MMFTRLGTWKRKKTAHSEDPNSGASSSSTLPHGGDFEGGGEQREGNNYEVFLSFRRQDTCGDFTDRLYTGLIEAGIHVLRDDNNLPVGEEIGAELLCSITQSKISIPIISEDYASNKRCLRELALILKCKRERGQTVLPIFYKVEPRQVRHLAGTYGDAINAHKKDLDERTVQEWVKALEEVASLNGCQSEKTDNWRHEGELIKTVVKKVMTTLKGQFLKNVPVKLVGIDDHVKNIMSFIDDECYDSKMIGIYGMDGIGKTTLAKVLYNELSSRFEYRSFMENIRETSKRESIKCVQKQLISDIYGGLWDVSNVDEGISILKSRFTGKKVLIVLDDVDKYTRLDALVGDVNWFKAGSIVILTTGDKSALHKVGVSQPHMYPLNELRVDQSLVLFSRHAFRKDSPPTNYEAISSDIINNIGGLPLALEVIGTFLRGKKKETWEATSKKLKKVPDKKEQERKKDEGKRPDRKKDEAKKAEKKEEEKRPDKKEQDRKKDEAKKAEKKEEAKNAEKKEEEKRPDKKVEEKVLDKKVQEVLKITYDALESEGRQMFLDIACFFIGSSKQYPTYMWDACGYNPMKTIERLSLLSLIRIDNNGNFWMHDQLINLGREIVRLENEREPERRSRLWNYDEAIEVLDNEKGTKSVEGVLLKFDSGSHHSFSPKSFKRTSNLRFLRLDQANLEGDFEGLLSSLRWLHWRGCPRNLGAENLHLKKLVILDLSWSKVNEKWKGWNEIKKAENLKVLNLTGCVDLIRTPDLSSCKCLERLILENCIRLVEIDSSVKSLKRLVSLNLRFCTELNKLPEELGVMESLEEILIDGTPVQEIPASISHMKNLRRFSACNCLSLIQLPDSMSQVESLSVLALNGTKLTKLPTSIGELRWMQHLSVSHCRSILKLPTSLGTLASLIELDLSSTAIIKLPDEVEKLNLLKVLKIDFTFVRELPRAVWTLTMLEELHASRCRSLDGEIPGEIKNLSELRVLKLGYSRIRDLPEDICRLPKLQTLDLLHCDKLRKVPKLPSNLISLSVSSKLMDTIPEISHLVKLRELFLADGSQELALPAEHQIEAKERANLELGSLLELKTLQLSLLKIQPVELNHLGKLRKLSLCCIHLEELPQLPRGLFTLSLRHYKLRGKIPDLSCLEFLSEFELFDCAITEVPGLWNFKSLQVFRVSHCNLQQLDELKNSIHLASLHVSYCESLERLPDLSKQKNLKDIKIKGCPKISAIRIAEFRKIPASRSGEHLNSFEKQSSSIIEAENSSKVEFSKPANTEPSSIRGVKHSYEAVFSTDMATSWKYDGIPFPVDDEDTTGIYPSTDGTTSETTDASIIPSMDNQTEGITDGIHQRQSFNYIFLFLFSLLFFLVLDRRLLIQTTPALSLLPVPRQGTEGDSLSVPSPPVSQAVDSRSPLARQYENINSRAAVGIQEPSSMPVSAANPSRSSPGHSLSQPGRRTDVWESSSSSARAKVALEQVARILHSRDTNSSNVTSESSVASIITDEVAKAKWTEFLELSQGGFPSISNDPIIAERLKALANELCGGDIRFTKSPGFRTDCEDFLAVFLNGIDTYQQNCERIAVLVVSEKDYRYPHNSIEEVCCSLKIRQDALQTLVNDRAGLDAEEADLERRLADVRNQQRLKDIEMAQVERALWQDIGSFDTLMGEKNRLDEEMAEKRRIRNQLLRQNSQFDHIMSAFQSKVRDFVDDR